MSLGLLEPHFLACLASSALIARGYVSDDVGHGVSTPAATALPILDNESLTLPLSSVSIIYLALSAICKYLQIQSKKICSYILEARGRPCPNLKQFNKTMVQRGNNCWHNFCSSIYYREPLRGGWKLSNGMKEDIWMLTQENLLLIDGDEGIRKSLSLFFGSRNCCLHTVENAAQALRAVNKKQYDIIICEELLPDMNGLNFFTLLNARRYQTIKILITWYGNNKIFEEVRERGIDCLLTKPFSGDDIEAAMLRLSKCRLITSHPDYPGG